MSNTGKNCRDREETKSQHPEAQCTECSWAYHRHEANEKVRMTGERMVDVIDRRVKIHKRATGHTVN